jgi:hypothetical protein
LHECNHRPDREGFDVGIRVAMSASLPSSSLIAKKLGPITIAFYASPQSAGEAAPRRFARSRHTSESTSRASSVTRELEGKILLSNANELLFVSTSS